MEHEKFSQENLKELKLIREHACVFMTRLHYTKSLSQEDMEIFTRFLKYIDSEINDVEWILALEDELSKPK